ncbi:YybS family protein [Bacillus gobiensis]|uniref:YybS family protein n=1 Tax=Bacillus gobiensis TaxID=1441095 RepID=UPI003D201DA9
MTKTNALVEGAIMIALLAVLTLASIYLPVISMILIFAIPLPSIIHTIRHGLTQGIWMAVASLPVLLIVGQLQSLIVIPFIIAGVTMGFYYKRKETAYAIASGAIAYVISIVISYAAGILFFQFDPISFYNETMNEAFKASQSLMGAVGNQEQAEAQIKVMKKQMQLLPYLLPTVFAGSAVVSSFITHFIAKPFLKRFASGTPPLKPFREWKLPKSIIWYYLVAIFLYFFPLERGDFLYSVQINAEIILGTLLMIQGLSFVFFYCYMKNIPKAVPIIAVILCFANPFIMYVVKIVGIADIGFTMREKLKKM